MLDPKNGFTEAKQKVIELKGDDPRAVKALLKFIYTRSFEGEPDGNHNQSPEFLLALLVAAKKYLLDMLAAKACDALWDSLKLSMEAKIEAKDGMGLIRLLDFTIEHMDHFTQPQEYHKLCYETVTEHIPLLLELREFRASLVDPGERTKILQIIANAVKQSRAQHTVTMCTQCHTAWVGELPDDTCFMGGWGTTFTLEHQLIQTAVKIGEDGTTKK